MTRYFCVFSWIFFSSCCIARGTEDRLHQLRTLVELASEKLNIEQHTGVLVGKVKNTVEPSTFAMTRLFPWADGESIFVVFVNESLLLEAPDLLLEHIAYHEVCHMALDHQVSTQYTELAAETCVKKTVGEVVYASYVDTLTAWRPNNQKLEEGRKIALQNFGWSTP